MVGYVHGHSHLGLYANTAFAPRIRMSAFLAVFSEPGNQVSLDEFQGKS